MARISQGDALTTPLQQPGGKLQGDGYGLLTATVVWKADEGASLGSVVNRGSSCPLTAPGTLTAHKYAISYDALGVATITVDYVGIDNSFYSGNRTEPQVSASQGLTTDHITAHPNFFELADGFTGDPIAGVGSGTITVPAYSAAGDGEFTGNNGATFAKATGGKFLGFKVAEYKGFYGRTNYLAPQTSFSGHFYTTEQSTVQGILSRVGKTSGDGSFDGIDLLPSYLGGDFHTPEEINQLLLAQVSTEDFGELYKVNYEVRFNRYGYEPAVYAPE